MICKLLVKKGLLGLKRLITILVTQDPPHDMFEKPQRHNYGTLECILYH